MAIFEKYHPLLSAHYTLDWLTTSKLKDVYTLRADPVQAALSARAVDDSPTSTAHYVNRAMHAVMGNQALIYGVTARAPHAFVGSVALVHFDAERTHARLQVETLASDPEAFYAEIIPRVCGFAFFELGLTTVYADVPDHSALATWLQANHFLKQPAVGMLALTQAAVIKDPRYRF